MNTKIILSLSIIGAVAAIAVGGTIAFFSDTETSTGNTFTAGTIDLKIDSECTYNGEAQKFCTWIDPKDLSQGDLFFNYSDIKPGDSGEDTISLHVYDNDSYVCAEIANLANADNGCNEPESAVDTTCGIPGTGKGELQNAMLFTVWKDDGGIDGKSCDNIWQEGEKILVDNQTAGAGYWPLFDSQTGGPLKGNTTACIGISWKLPATTGNIVQSDSMTGDISFYAVQSRNNDGFVCGRQTAN